jgi:hypothetical protein
MYWQFYWCILSCNPLLIYCLLAKVKEIFEPIVLLHVRCKFMLNFLLLYQKFIAWKTLKSSQLAIFLPFFQFYNENILKIPQGSDGLNKFYWDLLSYYKIALNNLMYKCYVLYIIAKKKCFLLRYISVLVILIYF